MSSGAARQRPSIYDVARLAEVSHMTVSRVLNGHPNIRESTRERVVRAIEQTGFTRSSIARALATQRAMRIGVVVDSPVQFGPNSTLRAIEVAARDVGYAVSAYSISEGDGTEVDAGVVELTTQGVDALCLIAPRSSSLDALRRRAVTVPTIVIKAEEDPIWPTVAVDQRKGARTAVEHLAGLGHRRIAHLGGPPDWLDASFREAGWRDVLAIHGLEPGPVHRGDWTSDSGYEVGRVIDLDDATAMFVANDQMALGLMHALASRGIGVPDDLSVVGFDDLPDSRHFLPPLTTVRQDFDALGALALRRVVQAIDGVEDDQPDLIEPRLIVRRSSAAPRR